MSRLIQGAGNTPARLPMRLDRLLPLPLPLPLRLRWPAALRPAFVDDRGSVTAEFAVGLPAVVLVLVLALTALQASTLQIRVVDAAAVAARSLARAGSDPAGVVTDLVGDHVLLTSREGDFVCARVSAPMRFGGFGVAGLTASARSCALAGGL